MKKQAIYKSAARPIEARVEDLLGCMTMEEKLGQLSQVFSGWMKNPEEVDARAAKGTISSFIWEKTDIALRNRYQRAAVEGSRLGIPILFGMDIIHGSRTIFPSAIGLSCSFQPELFERAQGIAAREARAEGLEWVFAPMCDLARDPRWGRVVETCGEDPYLSALCNAAQVRGFQGSGSAAPGRVAACLKHFVGYSAVAGGRDYNESEVTEWTLRNAHLPSFHAAVKAGALTVMSSFNAIGGIPAVANPHTLTEILRGEWSFPGFVVSDWNAVRETIAWGVAKDDAEAARLALCAGNDMEMLTPAYIKTLAAQVEDGRVPLAVVDEAVRRVLRVKFQLGLFERPYTEEATYEASVLRPDAMAIARECVVNSAVLLQNDGVLPISKDVKKIALIGPFGDDPREMLGCWSGRGRPEDVVTLATALRERLAGQAELMVVKGCDVSLTPPTKTLQDGSVVSDPDAAPLDTSFDLEGAVRAAMAADVVVMAIGETSGWTGESRNRAFLNLSGNQQALFDAVAATGKPIIAVVFCGRPLSLPSVFDNAAAVLYAWQPGVQAGPGLADLLFGDASPCARLSMSILREVSQSPLYYNYPQTGPPTTSCHYLDMPRQGAKFWFGHGLTYTRFEYGPAAIVPATGEKPAEAIVTVENAGSREGVEVVQLYIRQLACHEGARPGQELRGFKRLRLEPGQCAEVRFPLTGETLGFVRRDGAWQVDAGDYHIWIAPHARTGTLVVHAHVKTTDADPQAEAALLRTGTRVPAPMTVEIREIRGHTPGF